MDRLDELKECDHLGLFYQDDAQHVGALARLFEGGLAAGEQCVLVGDEAEVGPIVAKVEALIGVRPSVQGGPLLVVSGRSSWRHDEEADPLALLRGLEGSAWTGSRQGSRIVVDMAWALGTAATSPRLLQWEANVHAFLAPGCRSVVICQYDHRRLPASVLALALRSHPIVILHDHVYPNLYHEPLQPIEPPGLQSEPSRLTAGKDSPETRAQREHVARVDAEAATRRAMFLAEASIVLASSLDLSTIFGRVANLAVPILADWCVVDIIDNRWTLRRVATAHANPDRLQRGHELWQRYPIDPGTPDPIATVLRTGQPLVLPELPDEMLVSVARAPEHLAALRELAIRSVMVVPLRARGQTLGTIAFATAEVGRRYTHHDLAFAEALAGRAALAVDNAQLYAVSERRRREAESLAELGRLISGSLDPTEVSRRIADSLRTLLRGRSAALLRREVGTKDLRVAAVSGDAAGVVVEGATYPAEAGAIGAALQEGRAVASPDILADPLLVLTPTLRAHAATDSYRAVLAVPMVVKGEVTGILRVSDATGRVFDADEIGLARAFADGAAIAQENSRLYAEAKELAVARERVRVAAELHDTLSQVLFSIGLKLDWCLRHMSARVETRRKLEDIRRDAGFVMEQIRRLIGELAEPSEADGSFPEQIGALVGHFRELTGIALGMTIEGDLSALDPAHRTILGKVIQEALTNVAKHARATQASLSIAVEGGIVRFAIEDNGVGGPLERREERSPRHYGLAQMHERVEAVGGRLECGPATTAGFRVVGILPMR